MNYKKEVNKRYDILIGVDRDYDFNFDLKYKRDREKDKLTNWCFNNQSYDIIKHKIDNIEDKPLRDYAIHRLINIKASEMFEYITCYILDCEKCNKYDKMGDVIIDGNKYDVKNISIKWSGKFYRNYNSDYLLVEYTSKYDWIDKNKIYGYMKELRNTDFNGEDVKIKL